MEDSTGDHVGDELADAAEAEIYGVAEEAELHSSLPRVDAWRKRSAVGAVLTGFALGLQRVFDPQKKQPSIVMAAPSDPNDPDDPYSVHVEPDHPDETVVTIRPWRFLDSRD